MEENFVKAYDIIMCDKTINDVATSYLLCRYINKYERYGQVFTSDKKDAEFLNIDYKYVGKKRRRLKELGYIDYVAKEGNSTKIGISKDLLNKIGVKIK